MNWIGLRDPGIGVFSPGGLGRPSRGLTTPDDILPRGTLMLDVAVMPSLTEQALLSYDARDPWPTGLTLSLDPHGMLTLTQAQGENVRRFTLATGLKGRAAVMTVTFTWDAPNRHAMLSAEVPDTGVLHFTTDHAPLPLSMRDATRIMTDGHICYLAPGVRFAAIADAIAPIGPLPSLDGATPLPTPQGDIAIAQVRPGQIVNTADGGTAQVRWVGGVTLPARARFAPLHLRAPFYGARRDILCAPCQQIHFRSSEVEYLFATHTVSARAGDLLDGIGPRAASDALTATYWQVLLDRPVPVNIHGVECEMLDATALMADPALRRLSVLRDVPAELMPRACTRPIQRLQGFETRSLCEMRVA